MNAFKTFLITVLCVMLLLFTPNLAKAEGLPMGSFCNANGNCASGDCENSDVRDQNGDKIAFCDCGWFGAGCDEYGQPNDGGSWECQDGAGDTMTYDLDYCISTNKKDVRSDQLKKAVDANLPPGVKKPAGSVVGMAADAVLDAGAFTVGLQNEIKTFKPTMNIRIPGLHLTDAQNTIDAEGNLQLPWMAELISALYKLAMAVASILAVVMIIIEGVRIVTSGGGEEKTAAYKRIGQIFAGLFLVWGSYAILYTLNPDLVNFRILRVAYIKPLPLEDVVGRGTENNEDVDVSTIASPGSTCVNQADLQNISNIVKVVGGAAKRPFVIKEMAVALAKAEQIAQSKGKKLVITSAFRRLEDQSRLWNEALQKYGNDPKVARKYVGPPSCKSNHTRGHAVDVFFADEKLTPYFTGARAGTTGAEVPDIGLLQDIMKQAGFTRYCKEWWHFEFNYARDPSTRCSP